MGAPPSVSPARAPRARRGRALPRPARPPTRQAVSIERRIVLAREKVLRVRGSGGIEDDALLRIADDKIRRGGARHARPQRREKLGARGVVLRVVGAALRHVAGHCKKWPQRFLHAGGKLRVRLRGGEGRGGGLRRFLRYGLRRFPGLFRRGGMDEADPVLTEHKIAVRQNEIVSALRERFVQRLEIVSAGQIKRHHALGMRRERRVRKTHGRAALRRDLLGRIPAQKAELPLEFQLLVRAVFHMHRYDAVPLVHRAEREIVPGKRREEVSGERRYGEERREHRRGKYERRSARDAAFSERHAGFFGK